MRRVAASVAWVLLACGSGAEGPDARPFDFGDAAHCATGSRVLYLAGAGGTYRGGETDARVRQSELIPGDRVVDVQPFPYKAETFREVMTCVAHVLAPYDVTVTDVDPGSAEHMSVVLTTEPRHVGLPSGTRAAAPTGCGLMPNGLAWVFSSRLSSSGVLNCMAVLSEVGHLAGLEHVLGCDDAMSEAPGCDLEEPTRRYTDQELPCGIVGPGVCACGRAETQNSHQQALASLGPCG